MEELRDSSHRGAAAAEEEDRGGGGGVRFDNKKKGHPDRSPIEVFRKQSQDRETTLILLLRYLPSISCIFI